MPRLVPLPLAGTERLADMADADGLETEAVAGPGSEELILKNC
jgi:hypothetical protein